MQPPLLTYYGDDFTGSTDALESLSRAGVSAVLFAAPPSRGQLARFPDARAIGVAGISRALSPAQMEVELSPVFAQIKALGAPIFHYKTCSTFDSSPQIGSIGRAIDIGQRIFDSPFVPLVVGAPTLGRYVAFGNLFARVGAGTGGEVFRLDRHPTMSIHPTTPMDESDLRVHLGRQTRRRIAHFDLLRLNQPSDARQDFVSLLESEPEIVLFDTLDDAHLSLIGELLWQHASTERPLFVAGSSGVESALVAHWREHGELPAPPSFQNSAREPILVVSGSCSPTTQKQIEWASENGFEAIALDSLALLDAENGAEIGRAAELAHRALKGGKSPLLHLCLGPDDPRLPLTRAKLATLSGTSSELLGGALGEVLGAVWRETTLRRAIVTGGDTSSYLARQLGIEALEMAAPLAPGAPVCRISAPQTPFDGREIVFKGGQVGNVEFFGQAMGG